MLDIKATNFTHAVLSSQESRDVYFPDSVIEPFVASLGQNSFQGTLPSALSPEPHFTLQQSKQLILAALRDFDPRLEVRGKAIFAAGFDASPSDPANQALTHIWGNVEQYRDNPSLRAEDRAHFEQMPASSRWRILEAKEGDKVFMMRCLAAESPGERGDPPNKRSQAVIDFHFDGSMNSVIYLAHELGHAMADDALHERGKLDKTGKPVQYKASDNPLHIEETQAYFVQHIFYDYLMRHPNQTIGAAARRHFVTTMEDESKHLVNQDRARLHGRPMAFLASRALLQQVSNQAQEAKYHVCATLLGHEGPRGMAEVLAVAGITNAEAMHKLAEITLRRMVHERRQLQAPKKDVSAILAAHRAGIDAINPEGAAETPSRKRGASIPSSPLKRLNK